MIEKAEILARPNQDLLKNENGEVALILSQGNARLAWATNKELRALYGVDMVFDPVLAQYILDSWAAYDTETEEQYYDILTQYWRGTYPEAPEVLSEWVRVVFVPDFEEIEIADDTQQQMESVIRIKRIDEPWVDVVFTRTDPVVRLCLK